MLSATSRSRGPSTSSGGDDIEVPNTNDDVEQPAKEEKKKKGRLKIAGMKINSLRRKSKHFGLGGKGKKADLIERIDTAGVDVGTVPDLEIGSPDKNRYIFIRMKLIADIYCC